MRVDAEKQWPIDTALPAVEADRLADGEYVSFVERVIQRRTAMAGGAKGHALSGFGGIGCPAVVGFDQSREVHELRGLRRPSGQRADSRGHRHCP